MAKEQKHFYVLGRNDKTGIVIRCNDREIAEDELGLMRWSDCNRISRTVRPATEAEALAWFPAGLQITKRDSRFNGNLFEQIGKQMRRGRDTLNAY